MICKDNSSTFVRDSKVMKKWITSRLKLIMIYKDNSNTFVRDSKVMKKWITSRLKLPRNLCKMNLIGTLRYNFHICT